MATILGTGVDITEVRRLKQAVERWGELFLNRIFTQTELENAKRHGSMYQHLAGRFAAKEAIFKAVGEATLGWKDIEIVNDEQGKPLCSILNNRCGEKISVLVSISHVKNYAVANAVAFPKS